MSKEIDIHMLETALIFEHGEARKQLWKYIQLCKSGKMDSEEAKEAWTRYCDALCHSR